METKVLRIEGMSCQHCQKAVTDALKQVAGVESVDVNLDSGTATVRFDPSRASEEAMREAVAEAGYEVVGA